MRRSVSFDNKYFQKYVRFYFSTQSKQDCIVNK